MRFETSVLYKELGYRYFYAHETDDFCCVDAVKDAGWIFPRNYYGMVLVFSTDPVRGASTTWSGHLAFAGRLAMKRLYIDQYPPTTLWWWPEFVMEAPK